MNIEFRTVESLHDRDDLKRQAEWRERSLQKIKARRKWRSRNSVRSKLLSRER